MRERRGVNNTIRGERHHSSVLTEEIVREIRHYSDKGICLGCLVKMFGHSRSTIYDVVRYETWKHVR